MGRGKKLFINTIVFFVGNFASKCLSFILVPIYTSYLGAADFGRINMLLLVSPILAQFFSCEVLDGAYRYLLDSENEEQKENIITNSILLYCGGMVIFLLIYVPLALLSKFNYSVVFALHLLFVNFVSLLLFICRGLKRNKIYAAGGVLLTLTQGLLNILMIIGLKMGAVSILWAPIISSFFASVFLFFKVKLHKRIRLSLINIKTCKDLIRYSFPLFVQVLFIWILQNAGNYQLLYISGDSFLSGLYGMINKFPQMLYAFTSIFVLAWQETAVEENSSNDRNEYYLQIYNRYVLFQLFALIVFLPLLYFYFSFYNQRDYESIKNYIPIAMFSSVLISMVNLISTNYIVNKKTKAVIITSIIPACISLILAQITIPFMGINGVFLGSITGYMIMFFLRKHDIKREVDYRLNISKLMKVALPLFVVSYCYCYFPMMQFCIVTIVTYLLLLILFWKEVVFFIRKLFGFIKHKSFE